MPRVFAIADLHGQLPAACPAEAGDVLLLGGDICPDFGSWSAGSDARWDKGEQRQRSWLDTTFRKWLTPIVERGVEVLAIWGNHDFIGEHSFLVPELPWTLLQDTEATVAGLRVYGTPWVPNLQRWAFYGREEALLARADIIPDGIDVLLTHGPPRGTGDLVPYNEGEHARTGAPLEGEHVGDPFLNEAIIRVKPLAVVCGHIHEARGVYHLPSATRVFNVAAVDGQYNPYPDPFVRIT